VKKSLDRAKTEIDLPRQNSLEYSKHRRTQTMMNIERQLTRKYPTGNEVTIVDLRLHKLISWLLNLVFSTNPSQASVAMHIDLYGSGQADQDLLEQLRENTTVTNTQSWVANFLPDTICLRCASKLYFPGVPQVLCS